MFIHDLFYIIDKTDIDKDSKRGMYDLVRNILKYYRKMEIKNDVYDLWLNMDKVDKYLYSKGHTFDVELDDIFAIEKVEEYCDEMRAEDYTDSAYETETDSESTLESVVSCKVEIPPTNWFALYLFVTSTLSIGINAYFLFKNHLST